MSSPATIPTPGRHWGFLEAVIVAQARLVARWMSVGFIHGVMNTDNTEHRRRDDRLRALRLHGRPITPDGSFSSIDQFGRYAYGRQPEIIVWNLAQFASCLLPLMGDDGDAAIAQATKRSTGFGGPLPHGLARGIPGQARPGNRGRRRCGPRDRAAHGNGGSSDLISRIPSGLCQGTFIRLLRHGASAGSPGWPGKGAAREDRRAALDAANPAVIPRTHRIRGGHRGGGRRRSRPVSRVEPGTRAARSTSLPRDASFAAAPGPAQKRSRRRSAAPEAPPGGLFTAAHPAYHRQRAGARAGSRDARNHHRTVRSQGSAG